MHSDTFNMFLNRITTDGYRQGYDPLLFQKIFKDERDETEKLIVNAFNSGDWNVGIFLPELINYDGKTYIENTLKDLKVGSSAYLSLVPIAYNITENKSYLDVTASLLENNEDERLDIITSLSFFKKSNELYSIFKGVCLFDEDEFVRSQSANGMLYCKGIVDRAVGIHNLTGKWKDIKHRICDVDIKIREMAIKEFEEQL